MKIIYTHYRTSPKHPIIKIQGDTIDITYSTAWFREHKGAFHPSIISILQEVINELKKHKHPMEL